MTRAFQIVEYVLHFFSVFNLVEKELNLLYEDSEHNRQCSCNILTETLVIYSGEFLLWFHLHMQ